MQNEIAEMFKGLFNIDLSLNYLLTSIREVMPIDFGYTEMLRKSYSKAYTNNRLKQFRYIFQ